MALAARDVIAATGSDRGTSPKLKLLYARERDIGWLNISNSTLELFGAGVAAMAG